MPIYEFVCNDCHEEFDIMMKMSDFTPGNMQCIKCGSKNVSQKFTHIHVITSKKS